VAYTVTVYDDAYPNNTKTVYIDLISRVPADGDGGDKYILSVYTASNVYSNNTSLTSVTPVLISDLRRGWAQSFSVSSPITTDGGTLDVALDEEDSGALTLTVASGTFSGQTIATSLQSQLTASGVKYGDSNWPSYRDAQVSYEDGKFVILSGSTKKSYNDSTDWGATSSVHVTGGTLADSLGFTAGYSNSYDLATTTSGALIGPASAHVSIDDAVKWAIMSISNNIDFTS
jgi:hypothetical protein